MFSFSKRGNKDLLQGTTLWVVNMKIKQVRIKQRVYWMEEEKGKQKLFSSTYFPHSL